MPELLYLASTLFFVCFVDNYLIFFPVSFLFSTVKMPATLFTIIRHLTLKRTLNCMRYRRSLRMREEKIWNWQRVSTRIIRIHQNPHPKARIMERFIMEGKRQDACPVASQDIRIIREKDRTQQEQWRFRHRKKWFPVKNTSRQENSSAGR